MNRKEQQLHHPQEDATRPNRAGQYEAFPEASLQDAPLQDGSPAARQNETPPDAASSNLVVDIYDQIYHLRGPDPEYLQQLAALVDAKMRAVAQHGTTVDSLRVAVLAALNIADELVTLQQQRDALAGNMARNFKSRTETLAEMLDAALEANRKVS